MSSGVLLPVSCISCRARYFGLCEPIPSDDLAVVEKFKTKNRSFKKNAHIYHEGDIPNELYNLLDGWVFLYHVLEDGRRQIVEVLLPGAFFGFQSDLRAPMEHSALCGTAVAVCVFPRASILELFREHPELALRIIKMCARDRVWLHDHLTDLGRRTARERVAHFLLELFQRLQGRQAPGTPIILPFGQEELADMLGLSVVYTNRILREFKDVDLVHARRGSLQIQNPNGLAEVAGSVLKDYRSAALS